MRVSELSGLTDWIEEAAAADRPSELKLVRRVRSQLERARKTAAGEDDTGPTLTRLKMYWSGSPVERTLGSLDAAETDLLRIAPLPYLCGAMPSLQAHVNRFLPKDDPRRVRMDEVVGKVKGGVRKDEVVDTPKDGGLLGDSDRNAVVAAYHAANTQRRRDIIRVRSFRNVLLVTAFGLLLVAVGLGILGSLQPHLIPLCFTPEQEVVCPTNSQTFAGKDENQTDAAIKDTVSGWDIWLIEAIGLVAAALASAFALRNIRGTSTPYSVPVALSVLKLATGAITAVLGILLMRGGFVPGLSDLDSSAQILAWAIVFGYAQQLFTRMVDQQANTLLKGVGGRGAAGDKQVAGQTT